MLPVKGTDTTRSGASQGPRAASHGAAAHDARQKKLTVFVEGTAAMRGVASWRAASHGTALPGAGHNKLHVLVVGTAMMRGVASRRAASHGAASLSADGDGNGTKERANNSTKDGTEDGATVNCTKPFPTSLTTIERAGTLHPIALAPSHYRIGNASSFPLFCCSQNLKKIVSRFI